MSEPEAAPAPATTRWALRLEYDGTRYVGWQRQATGPSVQSTLEAAIARLEDVHRPVTCAGRTDAGVHAAGQVAHADLARPMTAEKLAAALNYHLKPHPIVVLAAAAVDGRFNARFSAIGRAYRYRILNRAARPALLAHQAWHVAPRLDVALMQQAADLLLGRHDFTSFRASSCQAASPLRTLDRCDIARIGPEIIEIAVEARSFLHHQVRNMVGTLRLVGDGRWSPGDVAVALAARNRAAAGPTAPPDGLCLMSVKYPQEVSGPF